MSKVFLQRVVLFGTYLFFLASFTAIFLSRYYSFQFFYYDLGIFARIIWQLSRFIPATFQHIALGEVFFLGDHFNPSLALLAPLFWITSDLRILLFEQVLALVGCSVVLYVIARKIKLSFFAGYTFSLLFLLFAGVQNPVVSDWHPEPTAAFVLLLFVYLFLFTKRKILTLLSFFVFLGFKESNALTILPVLAIFFFKFPERRRVIGVFAVIAVVWFFLTTKVLIPGISNHEYYYVPTLPSTFTQVIESLSETEKWSLVFKSLASFGFLPLLGGLFILPVIYELGIRIYPVSSYFQNFTLTLHYNVYLGVFLTLSSIYAWKFLATKIRKERLQIATLCFLIFFSLFVGRKITNAPVFLVTNPVFWSSISPRSDLFEAIEKVPNGKTIAAQNNLLPLLSMRKESVYPIDKNIALLNPEVILFDLTPGQNPNNFYLTSEKLLKKDLQRLIKDEDYKRIILSNENIYLFVKN